jgi:hypothetical protein
LSCSTPAWQSKVVVVEVVVVVLQPWPASLQHHSCFTEDQPEYAFSTPMKQSKGVVVVVLEVALVVLLVVPLVVVLVVVPVVVVGQPKDSTVQQ